MNSWCQLARVVNNSGSITFSASDAQPCNILVANANNANWSVTVGPGQSYQSFIVNQWSCSCAGVCGGYVMAKISTCDPTFNDSAIPQLDYDSYSASSAAHSSGSSNKKSGASLTALWIVLGVLAPFIIIAIVLASCRYCKTCCRRKRNDEPNAYDRAVFTGRTLYEPRVTPSAEEAETREVQLAVTVASETEPVNYSNGQPIRRAV